jgi:hypothetical protein
MTGLFLAIIKTLQEEYGMFLILQARRIKAKYS